MLETTLLVSFNSSSGTTSPYSILVELDDIFNVDANGDVKTSFGQEDTPYIRFNCSSNVTLDDVVATDGGVINLGQEDRVNVDEQLFSSRDEESPTTYTLPVLPQSYGIAYTGRVGAVEASAEVGDRVMLTGDVNLAPFLATISTNYSATIFQLIPPEMDLVDEDSTYQIYVVFYVTVEGE